MSKYTIQVASKLSGVGAHTLRAWEKRYQAVVPERNSSGRRVYSEADVEKLRLLSELCLLGCSIGTIANNPVDDLKEMLAKLGKHDVVSMTHQQNNISTSVNIDESLKNLVLALTMYKLDIISHEMKKFYLTLGPRQLALDVLVPLLFEVGSRVKNGKISLAQEHALNALLKFHISYCVYQQMDLKHKSPYQFVIASSEAELSEVNLLIAALLCNHYRFNFFYLGPNTSADSLAEAVKSLEATHVIMLKNANPLVDVDITLKYFQKFSQKAPMCQVYFYGNKMAQNELGANYKLFSTLNELDQKLKELSS